MAMTVGAIGAAAVMSMQKAAIQGNADARKTDIGAAVARTWTERLQRDAMSWTLPSSANPSGNNLVNTKFLNNVGGGWFAPASSTDGMSPGFDILGRDLATGDLSPPGGVQPATVFCVNVRLTWLVTNQLMRAEVRVLWPRGTSSSGTAGYPITDWCTANMSFTGQGYTGAGDPDPNVFHTLYAATAIRENGQ